MVAGHQLEVLNDAFNSFREASKTLEEQYAKLERRIEELNRELADKNKQMERTRRLAAMGEMAAKIAHEIRNPLGSIGLFASILERELAEDADRKALAEHISKGVKTLDNLLSNMLLFANTPEPRLSPVDIKDVIEDSLVSLSARITKDVDIRKDYRGPTTLMADRNLLVQLFINLLINAFDAIEEEGTIEIKTRSWENGSSFIEIELSDTGSGISREHIDRIFDPFFTTKERGTGLGLSIVGTIVKAHNGLIDVRSSPGEGTTFIIRLPREGRREVSQDE